VEEASNRIAGSSLAARVTSSGLVFTLFFELMPLVATEERESLAAERVSIFFVVALTFALMVSRATSVVNSVFIASDKWLVKVFRLI